MDSTKLAKEKIGILGGKGQVGSALARFYDKSLIKDLEINEFVPDLDILHVCIPWSDNFTRIVEDAIKDYSPKLTIIHSSVAIGTTWDLTRRFGNVVHSPVRGVHPYLYEGLKTFVKFVGADDENTGRKAVRHLIKAGMPARFLGPSRETELGKLLDTTYYGSCIAFHDYADFLCKNLFCDFDNVMTKFNSTYNKGYRKLKKGNVIRPILYPPRSKVGGHCIVPNIEILRKQFGYDPMLESIFWADRTTSIQLRKKEEKKDG